VEQGITGGTGDNTFSPLLPCTRGQIVTFLWRAAASPAPADSQTDFADISPEDYYYNAVLWAVEQGITSGISDTAFGPNAVCTRGQALTFLWKAVGSPVPASEENSFADVADTDYFRTPVLWAAADGVTAGTGADTFSPNAGCTRAEIVTFLYSVMGMVEQ
jgi:hypothetical protein